MFREGGELGDNDHGNLGRRESPTAKSLPRLVDMNGHACREEGPSEVRMFLVVLLAQKQSPWKVCELEEAIIATCLPVMGGKGKVDTVGSYKIKNELCAFFLFLIFICVCMGVYCNIAICIEERKGRRKAAGN